MKLYTPPIRPQGESSTFMGSHGTIKVVCDPGSKKKTDVSKIDPRLLKEFNETFGMNLKP